MPLDPKKIKAVMASKKLTNADLSRRTGMAPPHITRILSGDRNDPALSTAERIASALGCAIKSILQ